MRGVSVVMAYYNQPTMLSRQLEHFNGLPADLLSQLEVIIVDDGSSVKPAIGVTAGREFKHAFQLWKMAVDIRWNQDACRNLGVKHARQPWVLITDLDHLVPETTLRYLMTADLMPSRIYKFARKDDVTLADYKPHPNSWFMTVEMYARVGGYDERFAGYYGTDWDFRDRALRAAQTIWQLPQYIIRVGREHTPDASMPREFGRKSLHDSRMIQKLKLERDKEKGVLLTGRFPSNRLMIC